MLINHEREKLINAIIYFAQHTQYLGKIKLFKLLYLLDFEHFRQTGQSVTGLTYSAWKYGPVPVALAQEWDELEPDLAAAIAIRPEQVIDYERQAITYPPYRIRRQPFFQAGITNYGRIGKPVR